jgi:hypothetical protein
MNRHFPLTVTHAPSQPSSVTKASRSIPAEGTPDAPPAVPDRDTTTSGLPHYSGPQGQQIRFSDGLWRLGTEDEEYYVSPGPGEGWPPVCDHANTLNSVVTWVPAEFYRQEGATQTHPAAAHKFKNPHLTSAYYRTL